MYVNAYPDKRLNKLTVGFDQLTAKPTFENSMHGQRICLKIL